VENPILHYHSALSYNREVFLIQQGALVKAFSTINDNFASLIQPLATKRASNGHSHVGLVPFLLLLQRQARAAFELFSADQSYQGWLLARPGVEGALIIGKWVDDPANARVWQNRYMNRSAYRKGYSGQALRSKSLVNSARIQAVLSKINDDFVHANPDYYGRHLLSGPSDPGYVNVVLNYFDDDTVQEAHVLAFLHLLLAIQQDLADLVGRLFGVPVVLPNGIAEFERTFLPRVQPLVARYSGAKAILEELGSWQGAA
jgi:hypothetical protein